MGLLGTPISFTAGTKAKASEVNSNFTDIYNWATAYVVLKDVAATITANHTFSGVPIFSGNTSFTGTPVFSNGLTVSVGTTAVQGLTVADAATFGSTIDAVQAGIDIRMAPNTVDGVGEVGTVSNHDLWLFSNSIERWLVQAAGGHFLARLDNNYDIGAAADNRPRDVYVARNVTIDGNLKVEGNTVPLLVGTTSVSIPSVAGAAGAQISYNAAKHRFFETSSTTEHLRITSGVSFEIFTGGITVTGNSTITGTLGGVTTLTCTTVTATNLGGTLSTAAQTNVTSLGTLTALTVSGVSILRLTGAGAKIAEATSGGNLWIGPQTALATNATAGFLILPGCNGTPTGAMSNGTNGFAAIYDYSASKLWINNGGTWKGVALT